MRSPNARLSVAFEIFDDPVVINRFANLYASYVHGLSIANAWGA
jgi:hypothetical protein